MEITEEPSRTDERNEDREGREGVEKTLREITDEKDAAREGDGQEKRVKHTLLSDAFCADGKCFY